MKLKLLATAILFSLISSCSDKQPVESIKPIEPPESIVTQKSKEVELEIFWSDEFNYVGPPLTTKWKYEEGFIRNDEDQYYTKATKNVFVDGKYLHIVAIKEYVENTKYNSTSTKWQFNRKYSNYTSGSILTRGLFSFLYGYVEVRMKQPQGKGVWTGLWTTGENMLTIKWPRCGEIDIAEYIGRLPRIIHANNHFSSNGIHKTAGGGEYILADPYEFHIYGMEWNKDQIKFFVDRNHYATFNIFGDDQVFRLPQILRICFALGGTYGGTIDDSIFPQELVIDYVRVYKKKETKITFHPYMKLLLMKTKKEK